MMKGLNHCTKHTNIQKLPLIYMGHLRHCSRTYTNYELLYLKQCFITTYIHNSLEIREQLQICLLFHREYRTPLLSVLQIQTNKNKSKLDSRWSELNDDIQNRRRGCRLKNRKSVQSPTLSSFFFAMMWIAKIDLQASKLSRYFSSLPISSVHPMQIQQWSFK